MGYYLYEYCNEYENERVILFVQYVGDLQDVDWEVEEVCL